MARPVEFNKSEVLDKALEVFWEKGYEATSLSDLIDAMALSKSSFYNTFESKHQIFTEALRRYNECMTSPLRQALDDSPSGLEFIRAVFKEIIDPAESSMGLKGCLLMNTASEFAQNDPEIGKIVDLGLSQIERIFFSAIKKAQKLDEIGSDKQPEELAIFLVNNMSGLKTMVKAGIKPGKLRHIVSTIVRVIE